MELSRTSKKKAVAASNEPVNATLPSQISDAPISDQNNQSASSIEDSSTEKATLSSSEISNVNLISTGAKPYKRDQPGYLNEVYRP